MDDKNKFRYMRIYAGGIKADMDYLICYPPDDEQDNYEQMQMRRKWLILNMKELLKLLEGDADGI